MIEPRSRHVRQAPLTALTIPWWRSRRNPASAASPGAGSPAITSAGPLDSTLSTAISVPASLPAGVAGAALPSGSVTVISSSRRTVCYAVTTKPGPQNTPLEENRGRG